MKRIISIILALVMVLSFAGCGNSSEPTKGDGEKYGNVPPANKDELKLPEYNVTNKKVTFIAGDFAAEGSSSIWAEVRKLAKETYGIDFEPIVTATTEQPKLTNTMIAAGTPPSFVETHKTSAWFPRLSADGVFVDVKTLINTEDKLWEDMVDYINYYSIGDASYACVTNVYAPTTMSYNVKLIKDAGLKDPMELYKSGEWTWNKMLEYIDKISGDKNGDGVIDVYGIDLSYLGQCYMCSLGKGFTTIEGGNVSLSPLTDGNYEKFGTFASDLLSRKSKGYYKPVEKAVATAKLLFNFGGYWGVRNNTTSLAAMKAGDISLIPVPKHDDTDKYYMYGITAGYAITAADNPVGAAAVLSCYRYLNYANDENLNRTKKTYLDEGWSDDVAHILAYDVNAQPGSYQEITLVPTGNDFASSDISSAIAKLYTDVLERNETWSTVRDKYLQRIQSAVDSANKSIK